MKYLVVVVFALFGIPQLANAQTLVDLAFPVEGDVRFVDDFLYPRSGGRLHHATDIMAAKGTPVVAADDGVILFAPTTQPSYGYMIMLGADSGYQFNYVHLNNDTPGTDDGAGGPSGAYAPGIEKGARVKRGQLIGWVGDSGNAEFTQSHLHFEILDSTDSPVNPYASLLAAQQRVVNATFSFNPEEEVLEATSISDDLGLKETDDEAACTANSLIRTATSTTVYYCGRDGGRYVFQDEGTYFSWYSDFQSVVTISDEIMGSIPLRGSVTYKPGSYLLKLPSVSKVYAVGAGGTLHWIPSADIAEALYGADWAKMVRDLPESLYPAYELGEDVTEE